METFPAARQLLQSFIAHCTVNGNENPLPEVITGYLKTIGMRVQADDLGSTRANVYAEAGEGSACCCAGI